MRSKEQDKKTSCVLGVPWLMWIEPHVSLGTPSWKEVIVQKGRVVDLLENLGNVSELASTELSFPAEEVLDELLLLEGILEHAEVVLLKVDTVSHGEMHLTVGEDPVSGDLELRLITEDTDGSEAMLAATVKTLEPSTDEVGGHQLALVVFGELVVTVPDRPVGVVKVLPEPLHGLL